MTRSTRSAASQQQQNDREKSQPDTPRKAAGAKKRKRTSFADNAEQPANKVVRTQDGVKEEGSPEPADEQAGEMVTTVDLPSSGDVPLSTEDAEQILDVLEMADTQGLLDRIFPLPTEHTSASESEAGPSTGTQSYSFRALLKSPANYPLRVLRTAVKHLFPISTHSRSRPSAPAAEQIRFCQLALSLLDQASCHQAPVPLDLPSLIPPSRSSADTSGNSGAPRGQRKYALVQHLPTGDWWSSLNSTHSSQHDGKDLKDLPTAYAELVAILPSASASEPPADSLTLGQYVKKRTFKQLHVPQQRVIPCGSYLDYGPYATFAPTFEQNGVEIGRERLSEVVWYKEQDRRRRARVRAYREQLAAKAAQRSTKEPEVEEVEKAGIVKQKEKLKEEDVDALEGLLTPEQITNIKGALDSLELENAVSELLERNTRALGRLEELQLERLSQGPKDVEVGSEEWETAQNILDSLTLLASLRPRSTAHGDSAPLIPPASTLRKLHRTLPIESTQGWYGTLSDSRQVACSDDNTVRIRTGAPPSVPAPAPSPAPVTATAATTPAAPVATPSKPAAPSYSNYQYSSSYPTPYRGGYGTNYYPNYQTSATPSSSTNHYPNHQYATSGQQPYSAYSSWYNYQPPGQNSATAAAGAGSGPSAPAAAATPAKATVPAGYSGYFTNPNASTPQQPTPQRAVANTVLGSAGRGWTNGSGTAYVAPTIPPHMRGAGVVSRGGGGGGGSGSAPGTPGPQPATTGAGGYYIGYQQQVQQARS